jgi:hypothetical protein
VLVVPVPGLGVNGFTYASQNSQAAEIVTFYKVSAAAAEETNGRGRSVEVGQFVGFHHLPITRSGGVHGRRLEHHRRNAVGQRTVNDVSGWRNLVSCLLKGGDRRTCGL